MVEQRNIYLVMRLLSFANIRRWILVFGKKLAFASCEKAFLIPIAYILTPEEIITIPLSNTFLMIKMVFRNDNWAKKCRLAIHFGMKMICEE